MPVEKESDGGSQMLGQTLSQTIALHLCRTYAPEIGARHAERERGPTLNERTARLLWEFTFEQLSERITLGALAAWLE
jgi:hypothetical protein